MSEEGAPLADWYLYGIVRAGAELPTGPDGVQGNALALVESGAVAAVVTELADSGMLGTPEALQNHSVVLDELAEKQPVLPLAFGTVVPGGADIAEQVLAPQADVFAEALDQLAGCTQFTLRISFDRDAILREIVSGNPEVAELRERISGTSEDETRNERIRLGEIVVTTMESWRRTEAPPILEQIRSATVETAMREVGQAEDVAEVAVLVRRDAIDEFDSVIEELAEANRERMRFRLIGPQAPYDFVPEM
ncbi:GvpL/GvpF family gas vesicle protein [Brevibacterium spongiae]|uniref:GvpL/GvpF family gas vesicle protein n=1 Tax=Brevibacterium spongiae TaxID=2909672 RepID=A0ABY5SLC9_9MICO|nr:GvpL/GvpF family gas vesicle protein [Brevibacterium spongiae]UVI35342.1 GvpL/GvpF family gas vesicle protein [Brevibacterium spongiae]